tara:strand:+ start:7800 stop:8069 length:270 start_codon:yes stop_codon:yes gene_type:complete
MGTGSHITRRTLDTGAQALSLGHGGRRLIRCSQDTRFATDEGLLSSTYFTILAGQTLVLDPPNFFNELVWIQLDSATSGEVEIWSMGVN